MTANKAFTQEGFWPAQETFHLMAYFNIDLGELFNGATYWPHNDLRWWVALPTELNFGRDKFRIALADAHISVVQCMRVYRDRSVLAKTCYPIFAA